VLALLVGGLLGQPALLLPLLLLPLLLPAHQERPGRPADAPAPASAALWLAAAVPALLGLLVWLLQHSFPSSSS
jgi:hypothetical protein